MENRLRYLILMIGILVNQCMTGMTRADLEKRMAASLEKMIPLAKEIENYKKSIIDANLKGLHTGDAATYMKNYQRTQGIDRTSRYQNIIAELAPYQDEFTRLKYAYISEFGQIEYNEWIKRRDAGWGLGIYW